jgi:signal transduction histidine kinase
MLVDTDLKVRFINKSVGSLTIERIIGRDIGVLVPEAARSQVLERLRQVLDTGETATYEFESTPAEWYPAESLPVEFTAIESSLAESTPSGPTPTLSGQVGPTPSGPAPTQSGRAGSTPSGPAPTHSGQAGPAPAGHVRYFENRAVLVRDAGIGSGICISTRDITERKRLEQEILDISGRERHSIGRDLHDGLGQELTGVALMLRGLAGRVRDRCPDAIESVNEIIGLVNRSIENARSLARGLLPVRTETGGLSFALRELASRSRDLYGLEVNFRAEVWHELTLGETEASHLYRIAQEALTNSARHGHATLVDIFLQARRNTFLLCITDNGEGFSMPTSPYTGMGLKIMKYRADMIGAKFELAPHPPHGTVVRVMGEQPLIAADVASGRVTEGVRIS